MMEEHIYDMVIVGMGPAGLGCAIYALRAGLDVVIIDKSPIAGGMIINTTQVDNYLGMPGVGGFELGEAFKNHALNMGAVFITDNIVSFDFSEKVKCVIGDNNRYYTKTVILGMGAHHSKLGVPGEEKLEGRGVSYCATCDGAFFRKRKVAVVGGGDVAVGDVNYLSGLCEQVLLIHRRQKLRAANSLQNIMERKTNVDKILDSGLVSINGSEFVESITVKNLISSEKKTIPVDGVFIAVGMEPETTILKDKVELDAKGYVIAGEDCETSIPGVYAVGDIRTKKLRQVITAVADGAVAVSGASLYIEEFDVK